MQCKVLGISMHALGQHYEIPIKSCTLDTKDPTLLTQTPDLRQRCPGRGQKSPLELFPSRSFKSQKDQSLWSHMCHRHLAELHSSHCQQAPARISPGCSSARTTDGQGHGDPRAASHSIPQGANSPDVEPRVVGGWGRCSGPPEGCWCPERP